MNLNYHYNQQKRLLVVFDDHSKPVYAQSGPDVDQFMNAQVSNYARKCMKIYPKNTLELKIRELNQWLLTNVVSDTEYRIKLHSRNYYVNKLLDLIESGLMIIRA